MSSAPAPAPSHPPQPPVQQLPLTVRQEFEGYQKWTKDGKTGKTPEARVEVPIQPFDVNDLDLPGISFHGVTFSSTNSKTSYSHIDFSEAHFLNCSLDDDIVFSNVTLRKAQFDSCVFKGKVTFAPGTDLEGVVFKNQAFSGGSFRGLNLRGSQFIACKGLGTVDFSGANLSGAEGLDFLENGVKIVELSKPVQRSFGLMLITCLPAILVATADQETLFRGSYPIQIPFSKLTWNVDFVVWGPIILLCLFFYFQLHLLRLHDRLDRLPARFPDGVPRHRKFSMWLFAELLCPEFHQEPSAGRRVQTAVLLCIGALSVPVVLGYSWWANLPVQYDAALLSHECCLTICLALLVYFVSGHVQLMRLTRFHSRPIDGARNVPWRWPVLVALFALLLPLAGLSGMWIATAKGVREANVDGRDLSPGISFDGRYTGPSDKPSTGVTCLSTPDHPSNLAHPNFNLRKAHAEGIVLRNADLRGTDFRGADLRRAQFQCSIFDETTKIDQDTDVTDADFTNPEGLGKTPLKRAKYWVLAKSWYSDAKPDFTNGSFVNQDLSAIEKAWKTRKTADGLSWISGDGFFVNQTFPSCDFRGATFDGVNLNGADFTTARNLNPKEVMRARNWFRASYEASFMRDLRLGGSPQKPDLQKVRFEGIKKFDREDLSDAVLDNNTSLKEAVFKDTDVKGATFQCTDLDRADLSSARNLVWGQIAGHATWEEYAPQLSKSVQKGRMLTEKDKGCHSLPEAAPQKPVSPKPNRNRP